MNTISKITANEIGGTTVWLALIAIFWSPYIFLDYMYTDAQGATYSIANGNVYFFFISFFSASYLFTRQVKALLFETLKDKFFWTLIIFLFLSLFLSGTDLWGWRLISIIIMMIAYTMIAANQVQGLSRNGFSIIILICIIPSAFPIFASVLIEILTFLKIGINIENTKMMNYAPPRWTFLSSSANGFGLNAALSCFSLYFLARCTRNRVIQLIFLFLCVVVAFTLIKSGTRAAFIFCIFGISTFEMFFGRKAFVFLFALGVSVAVIFALIYFGEEQVIEYFRIRDSLTKISSGRLVGWHEMFELIANSSFMGVGFGQVDNGIIESTGSMFYLGIMCEIGVLGFCAIMLLMTLPILRVFMIKRINLLDSGNINFNMILAWSICVLSAFFPYLLFEFNVLRVSAANQVFFFAWCFILLFTLISSKQKNHAILD